MAISDQRMSEIAEQIKTASTWVEGERQVILEKLADELDGGQSADVAPEADAEAQQ